MLGEGAPMEVFPSSLPRACCPPAGGQGERGVEVQRSPSDGRAWALLCRSLCAPSGKSPSTPFLPVFCIRETKMPPPPASPVAWSSGAGRPGCTCCWRRAVLGSSRRGQWMLCRGPRGWKAGALGSGLGSAQAPSACALAQLLLLQQQGLGGFLPPAGPLPQELHPSGGGGKAGSNEADRQ